MTKKKTMKNIKTPNKFNWGGDFKNAFNSSFNGGSFDMFSGANMGKAVAGALPGIATGVASLASNAISNGFQTTGGDVLSGLGGIASMIPGVGLIAGPALELLGGVADRAFGTKWNNEGIAKAESNIQGLNMFQSGASSFDTLVKDINTIGSMNRTYKTSDIGEDGWFSNKAAEKTASLNSQAHNAYTQAMRNANNVADNISKDTLDNLERNYAAFGGLLPRKKFAYGGQTHGADFTNGLMFIDNGGTHESNPYEGIPISMDQEGNPNLVEEGEVIWNDYVFSNRLKVPKSIQKKYKLGKREMTFANAIDRLSKESEERPNDPISMRGLEKTLVDMAITQETIKNNKNINKKGNKFLYGGLPSIQEMVGLDLSPYSNNGKTYNIPQPLLDIASRIDLNSIGNTTENNTTEPISNLPTWMRYAPVIGHGALALTDAFGLTNKPDYSNAEAVISAAKGIRSNPIRFTPIGDYLTYNPFDTEYHANQLRAVSGATRRNIMNTSGGNRATAMAGILTSDNNTMNQLGDLYRKAAEYNLEQKHKVADFNRATNMFNKEGAFKSDAANQSAALQAKGLGFEGMLKGYAMKEQANLMADQARASNISGLLTSLGNIGYENANRNMMNWGMANGTWAPSQWKYDPLTGKKING